MYDVYQIYTQFKSLSVISKPGAISVRNAFSMAQHHKRYSKCVTIPSVNFMMEQKCCPNHNKNGTTISLPS